MAKARRFKDAHPKRASKARANATPTPTITSNESVINARRAITWIRKYYGWLPLLVFLVKKTNNGSHP